MFPEDFSILWQSRGDMWQLTREEQVVLLFLLLAFVIGIGVKLSGGIPQKLPLIPERSVRIYVGGAVKKPGWYELREGATLRQALEKASGVLPWADLNQVNLDYLLKEKQEISIPPGKMNLNLASLNDLICLPGIGPSLAQGILDYRKKKGCFESLTELKDVPGIGEKKLAGMADKLMISPLTE